MGTQSREGRLDTPLPKAVTTAGGPLTRQSRRRSYQQGLALATPSATTLCRDHAQTRALAATGCTSRLSFWAKGDGEGADAPPRQK